MDTLLPDRIVSPAILMPRAKRAQSAKFTYRKCNLQVFLIPCHEAEAMMRSSITDRLNVSRGRKRVSCDFRSIRIYLNRNNDFKQHGG